MWGAKSDVNGKRMDFHLSGGNNGMLVLLFLDVQAGDLFWLAITTWEANGIMAVFLLVGFGVFLLHVIKKRIMHAVNIDIMLLVGLTYIESTI